MDHQWTIGCIRVNISHSYPSKIYLGVTIALCLKKKRTDIHHVSKTNLTNVAKNQSRCTQLSTLAAYEVFLETKMQLCFYRAACIAAARKLSVRPSVKRVDCDKTKEISAHILIPRERPFILREQWGGQKA